MPQFSDGEIILNGKYRIEKLLGAGAFGEVYLATHLYLEDQCALKVLRKEGDGGVGSTRYNKAYLRFQLESRLGKRLGSHPHIIQVTDLEQFENLMVLVLEYAPGGSLQKRLEGLREDGQLLTVADALRIAAEIAEGLSALHGMDMVHRDVKPGNILFDKQGHAKLADFGLVQVPHGETRRDELSMPPPHPGTGGYMSPEQATPPFDMLTTASDIYALGAVLFEMLTGRMQHMLQGTRPSDLRPEVPAELDELVLRMLAQHPQERPRNGGEAARRLCEVKAVPEETRATLREPTPTELMECPICGSLNELKDTFHCKGCGRPQLCREHRDQGTYLCEDCERARKASEEKARLEAEERARKFRREGDRIWVKLAQGVEMEFVRVPAGKFTMGSNDYALEKPIHNVQLDEYWLGKYPVTNAQFQAYVGAAQVQTTAEAWGSGWVWNGKEWADIKDADWRHPSGPGSGIGGRDNHPVVQISWEDAQAFCAWLSRVSDQKVALPSEAQWEKAARDTDGRAYPWGNQEPDATRCNYYGNVKNTTPVGKYSPLGDSPYGCADLAGNVWEWCADWYDSSYYGKSPQSNPTGPASGTYRVLRGGSWSIESRNVRSAFRYCDFPDNRYNHRGFRCVLSLPLS